MEFPGVFRITLVQIGAFHGLLYTEWGLIKDVQISTSRHISGAEEGYIRCSKNEKTT